MNILDFQRKKLNNEKITMITCYDYTSARIVAQTQVDCVLVGDSAAITMHGFKHTVSATVDMICAHVAAVSKGIGDKFIIADLPFLSYRKSRNNNMSAAQALMQSGAHAVKLECAAGNIKLIRHLTESGIPVMGHVGLTPQFVHMLGGYKVQGKSNESATRILEEAKLLEQAGCFAIVLECMPNALAKQITDTLGIPTIGIGAGPGTNGQVLVFQDMLGLNMDFMPKFVKTFVNGRDHFESGINEFVRAVNSGEFPNNEHSYSA